MAGSSWDAVLGPTTEYIKSCLKGDKSLIDFCVDDEKIRKVIENYLENHKIKSKVHWKQNEISNQKRIEGNEKYKEKNYAQCLNLYTESIFYAESDGECLPLAYANRSLVLQHMGYTSESLSDVNLALSTGYPQKKVGPLILRKAKCLLQLGLLEDAKQVLNDFSQESNARDFMPLIKKELVVIEKMETDKVKPDIKDISLPEPLGGSNINFKSASKYLNVTYTKEKGRHVLATELIDVGDVLFVEKPFGCVFFEEVCPECGKQSVAPIPCDKCLEVFYCSLNCKNNFWKTVHQFECGFHDLFKSVGIAHLGMRILFVTSSTYRDLRKQLENISRTKHHYTDGVISYNSSNTYDLVYNLVTNIEKYEESDLIQYILTALLLALYIRNHTSYFDVSPDDNNANFKILVSILWRHIMQLICNGHAISNVLLKNTVKFKVYEEVDTRVGTAIYPSASMMNHSCEPSIINSFYGNILVVTAAKQIKKGEEVFNCYGTHARRMKRSKRQEILSSQYFFQCKCDACTQDIDVLEKYTAFKCLTCKGPKVHLKDKLKDLVCMDCGENSKVSDVLSNEENLIYSLLEEGDKLIHQDANLALKKFLQSWFLGRKIFYKFHKDLSFAADQVAKCFAILEDYERCTAFLKCCALSVEERFGCISLEYANDLINLGDSTTMHCSTIKTNDARMLGIKGLEYYKKAEKIVSLLLGSANHKLKEIEQKKEILQTLLA
ncbi:hypothetical protein RUM44_009673 [Polyplax serrata]|uniref:Protein-lysine N-methyltransferase SMYD4 n=1 Tax=Polyplax serrata TaxID=468196 RepID=A0ABR1ATD1_POLSC